MIGRGWPKPGAALGLNLPLRLPPGSGSGRTERRLVSNIGTTIPSLIPSMLAPVSCAMCEGRSPAASQARPTCRRAARAGDYAPLAPVLVMCPPHLAAPHCGVPPPLQRSWNPLGLTALLTTLAAILFSSLVWFAERGEWDAQSKQWLRDDGSPSPFVDIPTTMWWCIVTFTTVGHGDVSPSRWSCPSFPPSVTCAGVPPSPCRSATATCRPSRRGGRRRACSPCSPGCS